MFSRAVFAEMSDAERTDSLFDRTVSAVRQSPQNHRVEFAIVALRELVETYIAEADLARKEGSEKNDDTKLTGWATSVDRFASQLLIALEDVESGFPVDLSETASGTIGLTIADRMIVLAHPRADQQRAYEQRVLMEFCSRKNCSSMLREAEDRDSVPLSIAPISPLWNFTQDGAVCISDVDEIQIQFHATRNMSRVRSQCLELLRELRSLREAINRQIRHGVQVEWKNLALLNTPDKPEHLVILNGAGDSALLALPLLYSNPEVLMRFGRWSSSITKNGETESLRLKAENIVW
ncbi:MAG: hypothetical protein AB8B81_00425 [Halioglobus sp.]